MKRLPIPLNALRSFEAAARLGRMSTAAEELAVTHGAVSRQIKHLEAVLGVALFEGPRTRPRLTPAGRPELRLVFLPVGDVAILDTWHTAGLRGTASNDFVIHDRFIPEHRTCWFTHAPVRPEPLYRLPAIAVFATCIASVSLGLARHAITVFTALAGAKTPTWS